MTVERQRNVLGLFDTPVYQFVRRSKAISHTVWLSILLLRAARRSVEAFNRTRRSNGQLRSRSGQAPTWRPAGKELQLKKQSSACCLFEPLRSGRGRGRQCRGDFGPFCYDVVALEFGGLYARSPYRSTKQAGRPGLATKTTTSLKGAAQCQVLEAGSDTDSDAPVRVSHALPTA